MVHWKVEGDEAYMPVSPHISHSYLQPTVKITVKGIFLGFQGISKLRHPCPIRKGLPSSFVSYIRICFNIVLTLEINENHPNKDNQRQIIQS